MPLIKKSHVADFFLNEAHPYSKKRTIKIWHVGLILGILAALVMVVGTIFESHAQKEREVAQAAREAKQNADLGANPRSSSSQQSTDLGYVSPQAIPQGTHQPRQLSASQIIKGGDDSGSGIPMGSQVRAALSGRVESADSNSPVTAILLQDALSPSGSVIITKGTKLIGTGQLDDARERLQVRFHSIVSPEGEESSISGLAMMPDGSSGLTGDFSSGKVQKHISSFLGNFVGGLADGMKDRQTGGQLGIPFEPGGIKNGILTGVADSSLDFAKSSSADLGNKAATITVPNGKEFVLYFEREFHK